MKEMICWLNNNDGFVMGLLTFIYVVATIVICIFNGISNKNINKQLKESREQFKESCRGHIVPKIISLEGSIICLEFQNIGNDVAKNIVIKVHDKWLKKLEKTETFPKNAERLRILGKRKIFLAPEQKIDYSLWVPGNNQPDLILLEEEPLKITISYDTLNSSYNEEYEIFLDGCNFLVLNSDYVRLEKKKIDVLKEINSNLAKIERNKN